MKHIIVLCTLSLLGTTAKADFCLSTLSMVAPPLGGSVTSLRSQKQQEADPYYKRGTGQTAQKINDKQISGEASKRESEIGADYSGQLAGLYTQGAAIAAAKMDFASASILTGCSQTMSMQKAQDDEAARKNRLVEEKSRQADPNGDKANFYTVQVIKLDQ